MLFLAFYAINLNSYKKALYIASHATAACCSDRQRNSLRRILNEFEQDTHKTAPSKLVMHTFGVVCFHNNLSLYLLLLKHVAQNVCCQIRTWRRREKIDSATNNRFWCLQPFVVYLWVVNRAFKMYNVVLFVHVDENEGEIPRRRRKQPNSIVQNGCQS